MPSPHRDEGRSAPALLDSAQGRVRHFVLCQNAANN